MKKFSIKGATWDSVFLAGTKILTLLFSILSAKILSTGLSLTEYGTYSQANIVNSVGTSAILLGLGDALNFFYNKINEDNDENARKRTINTVFFIEIVIGAVYYAAVVFGSNLIADYFSNDAIKTLLPIVAVLPVLTNLIYFFHVLCVSVGQAKKMSSLNIITTIIKIFFIYVAVYVVHNLVWIYVVLALLELMQLLVFYNMMAKKGVYINPFKISLKKIKPVLAYSLPMGVYAVTSAFTREISKLVVGRMADTEGLAIYTNCSKILPFDFLVTSFAVVLIPYIVKYVTEKNKEQSVALFSSYLKVGYYSVWILGAMVLIAPKTIISFLYSDEYVAGYGIFVLYTFDSMLKFASMHLILTAANKAKRLMVYSTGCLLVSVVLNIAFYSLFGLIGPAVATLVTSFVYTFIILHNSIKILDTKWKHVFDIKEMLFLIISILIVWSISSLLYNALEMFGIHKYVSMIISMAVFGFTLLFVHFKKIAAVLKEINSFKMK